MTVPHGQADDSTAAHRQREQALRRAVLRGDESAWTTWYEETFDRLYAYVLWRCGGKAELAEEAVQETWLIAVRRIRRFDPLLGTFLNWVRGIGANAIRNLLRRQSRRRHRPMDGIDPAAQAPSEDETADQSDRIALVLDALPQRQEAVLRAKYLDQLSVAQIAQAWGETEKAIESLLTRARAAFRLAYRCPEINENIQALE